MTSMNHKCVCVKGNAHLVQESISGEVQEDKQHIDFAPLQHTWGHTNTTWEVQEDKQHIDFALPSTHMVPQKHNLIITS
jgi:hypothetical protein